MEAIQFFGGMLEEIDVVRKIPLTLMKPYKLKKYGIKKCHDLNN